MLQKFIIGFSWNYEGCGCIEHFMTNAKYDLGLKNVNREIISDDRIKKELKGFKTNINGIPQASFILFNLQEGSEIESEEVKKMIKHEVSIIDKKDFSNFHAIIYNADNYEVIDSITSED